MQTMDPDPILFGRMQWNLDQNYFHSRIFHFMSLSYPIESTWPSQGLPSFWNMNVYGTPQAI